MQRCRSSPTVWLRTIPPARPPPDLLPIVLNLPYFLKELEKRGVRLSLDGDELCVSLSEPFAVAPLARSVAVAVLMSGFVLIPEANATGTVNSASGASSAAAKIAAARQIWRVRLKNSELRSVCTERVPLARDRVRLRITGVESAVR